ncbi:crossover junction endodeoxyribonuclease RuvC [Rubrobacter xylanophilus DSM 9941]|uniref:Crossover junction endodeoxyribonuclease RuvC n=1 Tax=Rubrobacter xylanophilus (strain DSM 9941 / JCM 11954 / NBRC 16129 / PRD-1) TaxID=266117 RepID=RUVC_RUBXD|nr:crossover junction endodeoxyribonuclease RuvC [Rubrobacter xylanophilus]Q1AWE2.1 RecName: Full=Crossover junction endodeoxyribonuclease RuvC; AltName: Full=Holliday junction nuclease RuvC; AltName: Full=Holliday junction resolvase RuvC [Rubrobacter xylanophilus DSM 9941]ABG04286.1 crossover junction endodeoxyribonuclease RuvC [Rubrobacter xylanophilus DSM 9941]
MLGSQTKQVILGIDPGTATMGWGVVRQEGSRLRYVQHGAITTPSGWGMPRRLDRLFAGVTELIRGYRPSAVAVEELFFNTNVTTAITVGQARGVALLAAYRAGVEVFEYTPLQVKQAITSYGRADKRQVQEMVRALLGLRSIPRPDDAADGLAIAICHAFSHRMSAATGVGKPRAMQDN